MTKGAIAAGHPATVAAAAEILADGGNAFDAAAAAFATAAVVEPVLCSLGGGGFLLARKAGGEALVYDFFVQTPQTKRPTSEIDFFPIEVDFGTTRQGFHIGLGSIATPGAFLGLEAIAHELGSLPLARLLEPATRWAREGVTLRRSDADLFRIVAPILLARPEGRALFAPAGELLDVGDRLRQPELATALEMLGSEGAAVLHGGALGETLIAASNADGGQVTRADLESYRVIKRAPLAQRYRSATLLTNPPPSAGGILIAFALALLEGLPLRGPVESAAHRQVLMRAMEATNRARVEAALHEGLNEAQESAAAARLLDPALVARYAAEVEGQPHNSRGTTHISVIDGAGNLASLTLSNGEGCGFLLPGTGIMMNNMLGEEDLSPLGFHRWPEDCRISSMMAPTLLLQDSGAALALGSGGSNRLRTAILQVLINRFDLGLPLKRAVEEPRVHFERGVLGLEAMSSEPDAALSERAERVELFPGLSVFFGGVHAVERRADGSFEAAGDPRRGGAVQLLG
ncbi:MAG: gamma-glutamyltransferase family protein [Kiloniellales bacterium]